MKGETGNQEAEKGSDSPLPARAKFQGSVWYETDVRQLGGIA